LAGLRIAAQYPDLIEALERIKNSFNLPIAGKCWPLQFADRAYFEQTCQQVLQSREALR
jgi:histidinol-phosphate aminotransferase